MQLYCVITLVISKVGMRRKLVLTHGLQETKYSAYVKNFALQNRKLHYGINRILKLCVLELCEHLCSIFLCHLSLLIVKFYTLFKLFIIPVSLFRNKVLIYSQIILCTCQAPPTTWYRLVKFQHCKNKLHCNIAPRLV